ncbi:MAG: universal stress protein [Eggerthellaceae bacterium]|jgi:nucleotide-binding universal stress UspA family protein|nr:universal stress protein [Eggerthellaceae bacterium]MCH4220602.1 universal stress protein [Eggerthellaceae bacterium]
MAYQRILVAFDKSETACHALKMAIDLVDTQEAQGEIRLVSIMPSMEEAYAYGGVADETLAGSAVFDSEIIGNLQNIASDKEMEAIKKVADPYIKDRKNVSIEIAYGTSPAVGILAYAENNACDLIVMGNRGLGALRGALGSVSYSVLRSSPVPVLILK